MFHSKRANSLSLETQQEDGMRFNKVLFSVFHSGTKGKNQNRVFGKQNGDRISRLMNQYKV